MHSQFHARMFWAAVVAYSVVTLATYLFFAWQLGGASAAYDGEPTTREFAAEVHGLPHDLVDGTVLTEFLQTELMKHDLEQLWMARVGERFDQMDPEITIAD